VKSVIIDGVTFVAQEPMSNIVIVRTYSAGVHFGELETRNGTEVTLKNARRLWRWKGANTLNEVATDGVDQDYTRISKAVSSIDLTQAIEIIPVSEKALQTLGERWPD